MEREQKYTSRIRVKSEDILVHTPYMDDERKVHFIATSSHSQIDADHKIIEFVRQVMDAVNLGGVTP